MNNSVISTKELLKSSSNEDLEPLVEYILKASTEGLSGNGYYKQHHPNHANYTTEIYNEIRLFGGNTFVNLFRKEGPEYSEVLEDVARKVGVKQVRGCSRVELEQRMVQELLRKATKKAKGKEREDLEEALREAGLNQRDYRDFISGASLASLLAPHLYRIFMYKTSGIIASTVAKQMLGHGLRFGVNAVAGRASTVLLGPVAWVLTGIWTAVDIAGPACRVTIPCALHIAMLRQKWLVEQEVGPLEEVFYD